ncbi:CPBP family intramembrane glutamic endopeptidase [Agromyces bauzanensis]|uniref:CAAX prenyl protease 2/Lysostaphin resistance protein A-like domain-containing protein n=1 Tax=Agromyces bauzanensis TaxID=1308924 RepID=A0A917PMK2_9MICO|nr:CPBP family intramembrane glutamic endopeptidase [Agromyces bauzanensis]GGJ84290.1 hypothetical protein GCM10011372_23220 [Agromyces bauzanensis]
MSTSSDSVRDDSTRAGTPYGRRPAPADARPVVVASWTLTVLVSAFPAIVSTLIWGRVPPWMWIAQVAVAFAVLIAGFAWRALRPVRPFAVVMAVLALALAALPLLDLAWMPMQALFGATAFDAHMQPEQTAKLVVSVVMIGTLFALGYRRRSMFLALGHLTAPITPVRVLGFPKADSWRRFGLIWGFGIAGTLALVQYLLMRPTAADFGAILPMVPSILFYAALNALNEEVTYRVPMLTSLEPAIGSTQALWQAATFFGIAHYFGIPGGPLGAALSVFMGWILSKAMIETRGLFWAWWIHFLSDVAIFVFLATALV